MIARARPLARAAVAGAMLAGALAAAACTAAPAPGTAIAEAQPAKKRGPPPPTRLVSVGGVRYEAVVWGRRRGMDQNGGYVAATDQKTGQELWVTKVYATPHDPDMEDDKQDLFIARLDLIENGKALRVTDERGGRYRLDLATRTVTRP